MKAAAIFMAAACFTGMASQNYANVKPVESATIAELEAQREANNKKIKQYEQEMAQFAADQQAEKEYQKVLQDKIATLQENMQICRF